MTTPWPLAKLLYNISETNYDSTFSTYRFWYGLGATHGGMSNHQLYNDLLSNPRADLTTLSFEWIPMDKQSRRRGEKPQFTGKGQLIHNDAHLLLRFITDAEKDPILSTHAIGLHDRLCRESLEQFFRKTLDDVPGGWAAEQWLSEFYTRVNLIAHWVNLGYAKLEDVRDYILQSLALQPTVYDHQLNSLMILLRISGATFAAYVDPSIMDRCCALLTPSNLKNRLVLTGLAQEILYLRKSGWVGHPPPPVLRSAKPEVAIPKPQDPASTPVATPLGLPSVGESVPTIYPTLARSKYSSDESSKSSAPPSPSTSITTFSDVTISDSLDDRTIVEPEIIMPHDTFYLDDGSVEVVCGETLFRIHAGALSFHSPVLRQMFSPANLTAVESPNGGPRIVSSDTPNDFVTLLKAVYLPEFSDRSKVTDFPTLSSLLRVSNNYEMPNLRAQLLETIRGAYPETFEGFDPSMAFGENVFDAPKPHPNAVLNFFVQQKVTSALPMAYYMAVRRGLDSLVDTRLPSSATLSGQTLRSAMRGLMALREMELKETHRIVSAVKDTTKCAGCSSTDCPSQSPAGPSDARIVEVYQRTLVLSADDFLEDPESKFCGICMEKMRVAHAEVRKKAWVALPGALGLM